MVASASAGLVSALKTSLADADAAWVCAGVAERTRTRIASVSGTVTGTIDTGYGIVEGSTSSTSGTEIVTTFRLVGRALVMSATDDRQVEIEYESTWVDGVFSSGAIRSAGAQLATDDEDLDTSIRALGAALGAAKDTSLAAALAAGSQLGSGPFVPAATLASFKASLADDDAGWAAINANSIVVGAETQTSVTILASGVMLPPSTSLKAQASYTARVASGQLIEGRLRMSGGDWRTIDSDLHDAMMAFASAFLAAKATSLASDLS